MPDDAVPHVIVCRCACGAEYTDATWSALELVGYQSDEEETLELRNCSCGSTCSVLVK